jgi:hypothetical protein
MGRFEAVLPGKFTITFAPNENVYLYCDGEEVFEQDAPEEEDINQALGLYRKSMIERMIAAIDLAAWADALTWELGQALGAEAKAEAKTVTHAR